MTQVLNLDTKKIAGPIAQVVERSADNGEVSRSSRLRPTIIGRCTASFRGCSSVGRASALQAEGQRFDSAHLHQTLLRLVWVNSIFLVITKNL